MKTLGDHIRFVRLYRGLTQKQVAQTIGVTPETILHWELNQTNVALRYYPKIMEYLQYCPITRKHQLTLYWLTGVRSSNSSRIGTKGVMFRTPPPLTI